MQVTVSFTVGDDGVQLMLSIVGARGRYVTTVELLSLPAVLPTVNEIVQSPARLRVLMKLDVVGPAQVFSPWLSLHE